MKLTIPWTGKEKENWRRNYTWIWNQTRWLNRWN